MLNLFNLQALISDAVHAWGGLFSVCQEQFPALITRSIDVAACSKLVQLLPTLVFQCLSQSVSSEFSHCEGLVYKMLLIRVPVLSLKLPFSVPASDWIFVYLVIYLSASNFTTKDQDWFNPWVVFALYQFCLQVVSVIFRSRTCSQKYFGFHFSEPFFSLLV
jgi:hypothetical protein